MWTKITTALRDLGLVAVGLYGIYQQVNSPTPNLGVMIFLFLITGSPAAIAMFGLLSKLQNPGPSVLSPSPERGEGRQP